MKIKATFIIFIILLGCTPMEKSGGTSFKYKNSSTRNVTIKVFNATLPNLGGQYTREYYLTPGEQFLIDYIYTGHSCGDLPFGGTSDSLVIIFENNRNLIFKNDKASNRNPLFLESYEDISTGNNFCNYLYNVTNIDYNNAVPIEE